MATSVQEVARAKIVFEGEDKASSVAHKVGQSFDEVGAKAELSKGKAGGFFSMLPGGAANLALLGGAAVAAAASFGLSFNNAIEQTTAKINAFTKDSGKTAEIIAQVRAEAALTPFSFGEMSAAVAGLIPSAKQAGVALIDLTHQAEILAASHPEQGLSGAAFALREAVGGDFTSIIERFDLPRQTINKLKEEGVPNLEIVRQAMGAMGYDMDLVSGMANTAEGRMSNFMDTVQGLASTVTQPLFDVFSQGLADVNRWLEANKPAIEAFAHELAVNLKDAIVTAVEWIKEISGAIKTFSDAVGVWVTEIKSRLDDLKTFIGPALQPVRDEFKKTEDTIRGSGGQAAVNYYDAILQGLSNTNPLVNQLAHMLGLFDKHEETRTLGIGNGDKHIEGFVTGMFAGVPFIGAAADNLVAAANKQAAMYAQGYNNGVSFNQGLADAMRKATASPVQGSNYVGSESGYAAYASASYGQYGASTAMGAAQSAATVKAAEDAKAKAMGATARAAETAGNKIEAAQKKAAAAVEAAAKTIAKSYNDMQDYLKEVAKKIAEGIDRDWTAALKGGIKGVFNNLSLDSELQNLGAKQIITAIARGIEQFDSALIFGLAFDKVVADIKKGIKDSFQKAFDKLFAEIEQSANLTQGIRDIGKQIGEATTISPTEGGKGFEALSKLNDFVAPSKAKIDSFFTSLSEMVQVFGQKAVEWKDTMTEQAARVALYVGVWVDLVGKAIDPIVKLSDPKTIMPSKEAIDAFFSALGAVVAGFAQKSEEWKGKFGIEAVRFTNNIGGVVQILSKALDPLLKLPEVQKITPEQIEGAMANLWLALHHLGEIMKSGELQGDFLKRATEFSAAVLAVLTNIKQAFADWTDKTNVDSITKIWFDGFNAMFQYIVSPWGPQTTDQLNYWLLKMDNLFHSYVDDMVSYWNSQMGSLTLPEPTSPGGNPPGSNPPGTNPSGYNPFTPRGPKAPITVNNYGPGSLFVDGQFVTQLPADTHASLVQVARRKQQNNPGAIG